MSHRRAVYTAYYLLHLVAEDLKMKNCLSFLSGHDELSGAHESPMLHLPFSILLTTASIHRMCDARNLQLRKTIISESWYMPLWCTEEHLETAIDASKYLLECFYVNMCWFKARYYYDIELVLY